MIEGQAAEIREAIDAIHLGYSRTVSLIPHDAIINELESLTLVDHKELVCPSQNWISNAYTTWGGQGQGVTILNR